MSNVHASQVCKAVATVRLEGVTVDISHDLGKTLEEKDTHSTW